MMESTTKLPQEQTVSLEELVISHSYEMLALITVLEKKGLLKREEIIEVIKELQSKGGES
jgi:transketolase N-terminal domain/subunit